MASAGSGLAGCFSSKLMHGLYLPDKAPLLTGRHVIMCEAFSEVGRSTMQELSCHAYCSRIDLLK